MKYNILTWGVQCYAMPYSFFKEKQLTNILQTSHYFTLTQLTILKRPHNGPAHGTPLKNWHLCHFQYLEFQCATRPSF